MAKAEYEVNQPFLPAEETDHLADDDLATRVSLTDWKNEQQKELIKLVNSLPAGSMTGKTGYNRDDSIIGYPVYNPSDFAGTGFASPNPKDVEMWIEMYGSEPLNEGLSALEKQTLFNEGNKRIEAMTQQQLDAQTRSYTRFASKGGAAERLHAAIKLSNPDLSDASIAAAARKLYAEEGWSLDQVSDLVAMGRTREVVEKIAIEAIMHEGDSGSYGGLQHDPYGFSDDARTDVSFSSHRTSGGGSRTPSQADLLAQFGDVMDKRAKSSPNRERNMIDDNDQISDWKKKTGFY